MTNLEEDIARLRLQELRIQFKAFDKTIAWTLGEGIKRQSESLGVALTIEIRLGKETVFFHAMEGTTPNNADWVRRKRNTVELMQRSSYVIGREMELEGVSLQMKMGAPLQDFAVHGGGFPIFVCGVGCVGAATVSGVPEREDHAILVQALSTLCGVKYEELALD